MGGLLSKSVEILIRSFRLASRSFSHNMVSHLEVVEKTWQIRQQLPVK